MSITVDPLIDRAETVTGELSTNTEKSVVAAVVVGVGATPPDPRAMVIGRIGGTSGGGAGEPRNATALSADPEAVRTRIVPFVAPAGTVAVSSVGDTDSNCEAATPLKVTAAGASRL